MKVDTEGTEHLVLRGAHQTIERDRPVVICEILPRASMAELNDVLARFGYLDIRLRPDGLHVEGEVEFDSKAWNHAFVPRERLGTVRAAAHAIGLGLHDESGDP